MSTSVAGQAHRSPWSKKILATEWGYGQIQGVPTRDPCGHPVETSRPCASTSGSLQAPVGAENGQGKNVRKWEMFAAFPRHCSRKRSPKILEMTDLSAVFHIRSPVGTPLAFTGV